MINSRQIADLHGPAQDVCNLHMGLCRSRGIELLVTSTYRDHEAQDALYAIGRTVEVERRTVTNARGSQSWHNFRAAYDVVPLVGGKCVWDEKDPLWKEVIALGKQAGAEAGAEWKSPDRPHFQVVPKVGGKAITLGEAKDRWQNSGSIYMVSMPAGFVPPPIDQGDG